MEQQNRERVLQYLMESHNTLRQAVAGLSAEQRSFRPAAGRWSVADCVEHLTVVENFTLKRIQNALEQPPADHLDTNGKDQVILDNVPGRARRVQAPEVVIPTGRWPDWNELLRQFEVTRQRTIDFARETQVDLRSRAFPHPFLGPLDCYQWLLFLAMHCERHVRQMEEVKSDAGFPGKVGSAIA